jgi:hypothetical protein
LARQAAAPEQLAEGLLQAAVAGGVEQCAVRRCHSARKQSEHLRQNAITNVYNNRKEPAKKVTFEGNAIR